MVGSFLEKHGRKKALLKRMYSIDSSTSAPAAQELARRTTERQQRQFKEKNKKQKKKHPFSSPSNTKLNGPQSRSILGGHPIADTVPGYYGQRVTRKDYCAWGVLGVREREREREREIQREKDGSDVTIFAINLAMSFVLFLAKKLHLSIGQEFSTFPCQKFAPYFLPRLAPLEWRWVHTFRCQQRCTLRNSSHSS